MSDNDEQDRERNLKERILHVMRANEGAPKKQLSAEEKQKLKTAAGRLDQLLKAAAESDVQNLKHAAARLDQMLEDVRQGKDVLKQLKRRRNGQDR
jgi:predicted negative regulator of RcsB-dependent stress response